AQAPHLAPLSAGSGGGRDTSPDRSQGHRQGCAGRLRRRRSPPMKITDVTLTLFAWDSIPSTIYGHHTARPTGKSDLGLLRIVTDEGIEGHAFLGTSSNPASLDGPALIRFLKPVVIGQDPLDRERLHRLLWARAPAPTRSLPAPVPRSIRAPSNMPSRRGTTNRPAGPPTRSIRRSAGATTS